MKCPGQDMKYWKDDAIFEADCPKCGTPIEFYKDDTIRKCSHCEHRFVNPKMDFGCASYCQFAEQCLGTLPEEFMGSREDLLKDKVAVEMKRYFQTDFKAIRLAANTARYAEDIGKAEGGNLGIILCAAYLYDMGIDGAKSILQKVGANQQFIVEIVDIIESMGNIENSDSMQIKVVHDALTIRQLQEDLKENRIEVEAARQLTEKQLFTRSAQTIAADLIDQ